MLKLNDTIIPRVPFLWYREEEILCPIENIEITEDHIIVTQRNVLDDVNVYICLHSLMYYHIHKDILQNHEIVTQIPNSFNCDKRFEVKLVPYDDQTKIIDTSNGLKCNEYVSGSVFIHGGAFFPLGCLFTRINKDVDVNKLVMYIKSDELGIKEFKCIFILYNDLKNKSIDIKNI
jgi:hypothetical protein